jgi:hypothetical protein
MNYSVILYHSTQYAIWTGKLLKQSGLHHKMIPVPREEIEALLKSSGIEYQGIEAL